MTYLLPPLNALRAFEAAARHLSFKQAAHELHVTAGAVSQQVRLLEERLGVQLFERLTRQVILTPAGEAYLTPIRKAFGRIAEATAALRPEGITNLLHIGVHGGVDIDDLRTRLAQFPPGSTAGRCPHQPAGGPARAARGQGRCADRGQPAAPSGLPLRPSGGRISDRPARHSRLSGGRNAALLPARCQSAFDSVASNNTITPYSVAWQAG